MPHRSLFCIHPSCRSSSSPTGDFLCSLHCRSSDCSRRSLHPYFPTAVAEHASAEATFSFRCRSRARFRRSHILSDAAAEPTSAEATFSFRCRSRARFRRSQILFQMPQQSPLPQKPHFLSDAAAVNAPTEAFPLFPLLPQQ